MARYNRYPPTRRRPLEDTSSRVWEPKVSTIGMNDFDLIARGQSPEGPQYRHWVRLGKEITGDPYLEDRVAHDIGKRSEVDAGFLPDPTYFVGPPSSHLEKPTPMAASYPPPRQHPSQGAYKQPPHALDQKAREDYLKRRNDAEYRLAKLQTEQAGEAALNMSVMSPEESAIAQRTAGLTPRGIPNKEMAVRGLAHLPRGGRDRQRPPPYARNTPWTVEDLAHLDTVKMREQQEVEQMMANWNDPYDFAGSKRMARSGPEHVAMGFSPDYFGASNPLHEMDPKIVKKVQAKHDHHGPSLALSETIVNNIAPKIEDPSVWSAYTKEGWKSTAMSPEQLYGMGLASSFIPTHDQPRIFEGGGSLGGMAKGAATGYSMGLGPYGALAGAGIGLLGGFDTTSPPLKREITWSRGGSIPMPTTSSASYYQSLLG